MEHRGTAGVNLKAVQKMKKARYQAGLFKIGLGGHSDHRTEVCPHASKVYCRMSKEPKWKDAWFIAALWVCLMSGIGSIAREMVVLFVPTFAPPTQVFQACAVSCFVLSGWVVLFRLRRRVHELESTWTPRHQYYFDIAQASLEKRGDLAAKTLSHLRMAGHIATGMGDSLNLPPGIKYQEFLKALRQLAEDLVIHERVSSDGSEALAFMNQRTIWTIPAGMETVLDKLLYPPVRS